MILSTSRLRLAKWGSFLGNGSISMISGPDLTGLSQHPHALAEGLSLSDLIYGLG